MSRTAAFSALTYLIRCELVKLLRVPAFAIPTLLFPILFFALFGLPSAGKNLNNADVSYGAYLMASYGAYAVMAVALFSFGTSIASERGLGWNRLLRATPLRASTFFAAKTAMALLVGLLALLLLFAFGALVGGIRMGAATWTGLIGLSLIGMVPFIALGLCIGYVAGPSSAPPVANLIFLPLSFASGLFIPLPFLPAAVRAAAPCLPAYHTAQLGWTLLGAGDGRGTAFHLLWVAGYALVFLGLALLAFRRDQGINFR